MEVVTVRLSKAVFSAEAVARASHRHSGLFFARITANDQEWIVELAPKLPQSSVGDVGRVLENDALDELLRIQIRAQTAGISELLLSAALSHAGHTE